MPRYSAICRVETPAVAIPSTSDLSMPASARALIAPSACSCNEVLFGTWPILSDSSTPAMAAARYKGWGIGFPPRLKYGRLREALARHARVAGGCVARVARSDVTLLCQALVLLV